MLNSFWKGAGKEVMFCEGHQSAQQVTVVYWKEAYPHHWWGLSGPLPSVTDPTFDSILFVL